MLKNNQLKINSKCMAFLQVLFVYYTICFYYHVGQQECLRLFQIDNPAMPA